MNATLLAGVAAIILMMSSILGFVVVQNTGPRARLRMRTAAIAGARPAVRGANKKAPEAPPAGRKSKIMSRLAEAGQGATSRRVALRLMMDRAGSNMSTRTFYVLSAVSAVVFTLLWLAMGESLYIAPFVAIVMGVGFPRWLLGTRARKRQTLFTRHFADALDVIVRGIKSGLPVGECLNIIAREAAEPVCSEFKLLVESQKLGLTLKEAMERSCRRMPTADMKFFAIVINLQQQTGGNLAETLSGLSDVLRGRKKMQEKIKAMSSEARMTAWIIGSMPFLISGMVYLISPGYIGLLFTDHTGRKILFGGLTWMCIGVLIMRQMTRFEI